MLVCRDVVAVGFPLSFSEGLNDEESALFMVVLGFLCRDGSRQFVDRVSLVIAHVALRP